MTDPADLLRRLQVSLISGYMPPDVARWLAKGVEKYLDGQPLDAALDLKTGPGKPNPAAQIRLAERDELIRRAARNMPGSTWSKAGVLVQAVRDLDAVQAAGLNFKNGANRALLPSSLGGSRLTYLSEIRRCGMDIPASQSQLSKILAGRPTYTKPRGISEPASGCPCDGCDRRSYCSRTGHECEAFTTWTDLGAGA